MDRPTLYLETTIPSYLTARRSRNLRLAADQAITEEWWETKRHDYELFASQVVEIEAGEGDATMAAARLRALDGITRLPAVPEADDLIEHLLGSGIIPTSAAADAAHIAPSAVHAMDFLLTWNCKHINNPHLLRRIERACVERGVVLSSDLHSGRTPARVRGWSRTRCWPKSAELVTSLPASRVTTSGL